MQHDSEAEEGGHWVSSCVIVEFEEETPLSLTIADLKTISQVNWEELACIYVIID